MRIHTLAIAAAALLAACTPKDKTQTAAADSLGRDLELAPVDSTAVLNDTAKTTPAPVTTPPASNPRPPVSNPRPPSSTGTPAAGTGTTQAPTGPAVAPAPLTLPSGTVVTASMVDSITSRHNKNKDIVTATIGADVKDQNGRVIIPAGSTARFTVWQIAPAENKSATDGILVLRLASITVRGKDYPLTGRVSSVEHSLRGRGVTAGDAAKVGGGAAAGAVAGRVIGGKSGTVIGAVVGAAVGTGVAVETADRDVVVKPGAPIVFTLTQELVVSPN
ncbi:MAG TPA: hypothetical protein VGP80_10325 [Gemmatimonadales bacterium]|jgi:hypothetical protein|nr:hypothetical protein [Gemmatimonadales bacterium]